MVGFKLVGQSCPVYICNVNNDNEIHKRNMP